MVQAAQRHTRTILPSLMVAFGTDLAATQWVATGFLVARTLVIPLLGWLGSMLGNRNLFVVMLGAEGTEGKSQDKHGNAQSHGAT